MAELSIDEKINKKNLLLLISLRWIAVAGQIAAILAVHFWIGVRLPLPAMTAMVALLGLVNLISLWRARSTSRISIAELFLQLLVDVATLTAQLYLSGGAANPFVSLFLLQVILGAVLLRSWLSWVMVAIASCCFVWLATVQDHYAAAYFGGEHSQANYNNLHLQGMFICFLLASVLLVFYLTRIYRNQQDRELLLADLRRQAIEEEHIVRIGLLASGAAHELGTPLATLSVILNDWEKLPALRRNKDLATDFEEMRTALARCKSIISNILLASGAARGEEMQRTSLVGFFDELVRDWRQAANPGHLDYANRILPDIAIASDRLLKQILGNVLDNALEASPDWVAITVWRDDDDLQMEVKDRGAGFPAEILPRLGQPYQSSKMRPGAGLGLFLVTMVLRKLGGALAARNLAGGGALVTVRIPIRALAIEAGDD